MNGLLILDKPADCTSHQAVSRLKKILDIKKAGHTGTLDPFATGVLPVCFNKATKLIPYLCEETKQYAAEIELGTSTNTMDYTGEIISEKSVDGIEKSNVESVMSCFKGRVKQVPPMFSALKIKGERLYNLARKGLEVEREPREIFIHEIKLQEFNPPVIKVYVNCSKGTYVRALASDIGDKLGCGAHLSSLRRLGSGNFIIENSYSFNEIESGRYNILSASEILSGYISINIDLELTEMIKNGRQITKKSLLKILLPNFDKMDIIKTLFEGEVISLSEAKISSSEFEYAEDEDIIFQHLRVLN